MIAKLYQKRVNQYYPAYLYDIVLDLFSIVQFWQPPVISGSERGRLFEKIFASYCEYKHLNLTEKAGSKTICGIRSASGFMHENDGVIAFPDLTIHLELKHLSSELHKNELLIFNQKGLDFLTNDNDYLRKKPLYRIILSGNLLSNEARAFALNWGILVIEPDRLPLLTVHEISNLDLNSSRNISVKMLDQIWKIIPNMVTPIQEKVNRLSKAFIDGSVLTGKYKINFVINTIQREWGDFLWSDLDGMSDNNWLEERFDQISWELGLDEL